jgi:hypothetical protein
MSNSKMAPIVAAIMAAIMPVPRRKRPVPRITYPLIGGNLMDQTAMPTRAHDLCATHNCADEECERHAAEKRIAAKTLLRR